jgi:hypothetical protein
MQWLRLGLLLVFMVVSGCDIGDTGESCGSGQAGSSCTKTDDCICGHQCMHGACWETGNDAVRELCGGQTHTLTSLDDPALSEVCPCAPDLEGSIACQNIIVLGSSYPIPPNGVVYGCKNKPGKGWGWWSVEACSLGKVCEDFYCKP